MDSANRTTVLVHYYRAMVGRADVWRMRMDTTTNWAIGATAAVISFTLGNATVPHYVVAIATLMTWSFLLLEARRLTFYHLFQQRVLLLEQGLLRPALVRKTDAPGAASPSSGAQESLAEETEGSTLDLATALEGHLGRTVPTMPLIKAIARRLRRVYLYLYAVQLLAWVLKLANHPEPANSFATIVERAHAGVLSGQTVMTIVGAFAFLAIALSTTRGGVDHDPD